jgi:hypothetical protein
MARCKNYFTVKHLIVIIFFSVFVKSFSQNTPPLATSKIGKAFSGVTTNITLNAVDQDGDNLTYSLITPPTNGSVTITDGVLIYTSNSGFTGSDTITYKVNDGFSDSNEATLQINVIDKEPNLNWANYSTAIISGSTQDNSGNIFTSGSFSGFSNFQDDTTINATTSSGLRDGYVAKYNTNGDLQWVNTFGGEYDDFGNKVSVGSDGNIIMVGTIRGLVTFSDGSTLDTGGESNFKTIVIKLDSSDGSIIWKTLIQIDRIGSGQLALASNNDIIISSKFQDPSSFSSGDWYFFKVSYVDGSIILDDKILKAVSSTSGSVGTNFLILDNNDNIIITGTYNEDLDVDLSSGVTPLPGGVAKASTYLIKYNSNFELVWAMDFISSRATSGVSLAYDSINDLIYFVGSAYDVDMNPLGDPVHLEYNDDSGSFVASYNSNGILNQAHLLATDSNSFAGKPRLRVKDDKLIVFGLYKNSPDLDITSETYFPTGGSNSYGSRYVSIYDLNGGAKLTGQYFLGQHSYAIYGVPTEVFLNGNNLTVATDKDIEVELYDYNYNPLVTFSNITTENNSSIYRTTGLVSFKIGDVTVPVITLLGDATVDIEVGTTYTDAGATAIDNHDGDIASNIVTVSTVDTAVLGVYSVTYNVSDAAGNAAIEVTRTVNVVDTTVPVIALLGDATVTIETGTTYTDAGAIAIDNYDGDITSNIVTVSTVNNVDTSVAGTYSVTYNVSDANGNIATEVIRTVIIESGLSVEDESLLAFSIYPNPTNKTLFISGIESPLIISIYNALGKEVFSVNNTDNINVQALPSGVYTIRISDGVRQTNKKFIKN